MSNSFLHLDRLGTVDEETVFELDFTNAHQAGPTHKLQGHGIYSDVGKDDYEFMEDHFEDGLSVHGKSYLYKNIAWSREALSNQEQFLEIDRIIKLLLDSRLDQNWVIEIIFELIRRRSYFNKPSRFQSVFAASSEENLHRWMNLPQVNAESGDIYEVCSDSYFESDASLLSVSESTQDLRQWAEYLKMSADQYWSKEYSDNPVPEVLLEPDFKVEQYVESITA